MNIYHGKPMLQWSLGDYKKINDILNRLKYIFPAQVLLILYISHYLSHTLIMGPWYGPKL